MAYNKEEVYKQAVKAIKDNNLFYIEDIVAWLPCGKTYFYDTFPLDSEEMNTFKRMLENNKVITKSSIRAKLFKSNKSGELIALYKLIGTDEERKRLSQHYTEVSGELQTITKDPFAKMRENEGIEDEK